MSRQYIMKINLLIDGDIDDIKFQDDIENKISQLVEGMPKGNNGITVVSSQYTDLEKNLNYGKCVTCGTWSSDYSHVHSIDEFSNGAKINDLWYCDLCLPKNHPNHF